ncbi:MAG: sigma 54-interacting transcriptional regulator [Deltaproteobacteria bacterium]|nr:sigma 54-interacting transcriptional regulator [Deltaproteobacteria bacterium]
MDYPNFPPTNVTTLPVLVLCFAQGGRTAPQRRKIPREGLLLGRGVSVFDDAFRDAHMAARHAEIKVDRAGRITVRDLGTPYGTRINGEFLSGERELESGDVLRLGDTLMVYTRMVEGRPAESDLGANDGMLAVQRSIGCVAARRHSVVITGETGTGKEVVARMIHEKSGRHGPFVAVNCSTFTEALLSSELFGHTKGAFTGAVTDSPGLFRAANGGTLLLDEMAEIPLSLQASLLRVLETQEVRPVGGTRDISVDVRVIATVNQEMMDLVRAGKFRADLYARLAQWTIRLPKLNERRDDIPLLVGKILPRVDGRGRTLSPDLAEALLVHDWPLNVRGLLNILSIAIISTEDEEAPLAFTPEVQMAMWTTRSLTAEVEKTAEPTRTTLDKEELEELMVQFNGHVAAAGRHVGMTRSKLYRLLEAHGLEPNAFREGVARAPQGGQNQAPSWQHAL